MLLTKFTFAFLHAKGGRKATMVYVIRMPALKGRLFKSCITCNSHDFPTLVCILVGGLQYDFARYSRKLSLLYYLIQASQSKV